MPLLQNIKGIKDLPCSSRMCLVPQDLALEMVSEGNYCKLTAKGSDGETEGLGMLAVWRDYLQFPVSTSTLRCLWLLWGLPKASRSQGTLHSRKRSLTLNSNPMPSKAQLCPRMQSGEPGWHHANEMLASFLNPTSR